MVINDIVLSIVFSIITLLSQAQRFTSDDILGTWLTTDKSGEITIFEREGRYFGRVTAGTNEQKFDIIIRIKTKGENLSLVC